jgi:hypothetical protein
MIETIYAEKILSDEEMEKDWKHRRLYYADHWEFFARHVVTREAIIRTSPEGELLARVVTNGYSQASHDEAFQLLRTVKGSLTNRPSIIGRDARMPDVRSDGRLSTRIVVPREVLKNHGGKADYLGFMDYGRQGDGSLIGKLTPWSENKPRVYLGTLPFAREVSEVFQIYAPNRYKRQLMEVDKIPHFLIPKTPFTTNYVLKNTPESLV